MLRHALAMTLLGSSFASSAEIAITLQGGETYAMSQNTNAQSLTLNDKNHLAAAFERQLPDARYGLYYSTADHGVRNEPNLTATVDYWLLQSAARIPLNRQFDAYLGAALGVSRISLSGADADSYFAGGLYTAIEYGFLERAALRVELRWLASAMEDRTRIGCNTDERCAWYLDGTLLNQFQSSLGFSYRF